jgi:Fe-S cluster assembly protein SufD
MVEVIEKKHAFLADFEAFEKNLTIGGPSWLPGLRREAIGKFGEMGIPTTRHEEWKYTSLKPLEETVFDLANRYRSGGLTQASVSEMIFDVPDAIRIVFVNGHFSPELSDLHKLPKGVRVDSLGASLGADETVASHLTRHVRLDDRPFVALNTAFLKDGALVHVAKGVVLERPIHLISLGRSEEGRPAIFHPRNLVVAEENCQFTLIESHAGARGEVYFANAVTEMVLAENAVVQHYKVNRDSSSAFHVAMQQVRQARTSNLYSFNISFGGRIVRNDIEVVLDGEGCEATIDGLYVVTASQHVDNHTLVDHAKPHCASHELYKGILDGDATSAFAGKIFVREGAQKTDAKQTNQNMLLSDTALANTKPQLEIYADDVKCTHGATIGQLDRDAVFYLRSRGIGLEAAKSLLTYAFANDIIQRIKNDALREQLDEYLFSHLPEGRIQDDD